MGEGLKRARAAALNTNPLNELQDRILRLLSYEPNAGHAWAMWFGVHLNAQGCDFIRRIGTRFDLVPVKAKARRK